MKKYLCYLALIAGLGNAGKKEKLEKFAVHIVDMMPSVNVTFANQPTNLTLLLDNNANYTYSWTSACKQGAPFAKTQSCASAPTLLTPGYDTKAMGTNLGTFSNYTEGGYTMSGSILQNQISMYNTSKSAENKTDFNMYMVNTVSSNSWFYNQNTTAQGALALGNNSQTLESPLIGQEWAIQLGNVANQTFAGGDYEEQTAQLIAGSGDYDTIFKGNRKNSLCLNWTHSSNYISNISFGVVDYWGYSRPYNAWWQQMFAANPYEPVETIIAYNYQGVGLPSLLWNQFVNLLTRVDSAYTEELTCTAEVGGRCVFDNVCDEYPDLWYTSFYMTFTNNTNYAVTPLSALAANQDGKCHIYVSYLDGDQVDSNKIILGSMFMQQYTAYFNAQDEILITIQNNWEFDSYIGSGSIYAQSNDFVDYYQGDINQVKMTTNTSNFQTTISANIGFQGYTDFALSLEASWLEVFGQDCVQNRTKNWKNPRSCEKSPYNTTNYFDETGLDPLNTYNDEIYDGFVVSGNQYVQQLCVNASYSNPNLTYFCTVDPQQVYVTNIMSGNYWNKGGWAASGIIGLGSYSPIWRIQDSDADQGYNVYDIQMANYNNWTFANASYVPTFNESILTLGLRDYPEYDEQFSNGDYISMWNYIEDGNIYMPVYLFGFGQTYANNSCYYESLKNANDTLYGSFPGNGSAIMSLDYRGLGLPAPLFWEFGVLMSYITQGDSYCYNQVGGYCTLPNTCDSYPDLWNYTFQYAASEYGPNLIVPLATFAYEEHGICHIMVEYLDNQSEDESTSIIFGSMFYQSVWPLFLQFDWGYSYIYLMKNVNALNSTQIIQDVPQAVGPNPFPDTISKKNITGDQANSLDGLPTFKTTVNGISATDPYFIADLRNDDTVVWPKSCWQSGNLTANLTKCSEAPSYLNQGFQYSNAKKTDVKWLGKYENKTFSGYETSGYYVENEICFASVCQITVMYLASNVTQNNYFYNDSSVQAYGIIGMGPNSPFWQSYTNISTHTVTYSIAIARTNKTANGLPPLGDVFNNETSNFTVGWANDAAYVNTSSVYLTSTENFTYPLNNLGFGPVYYANGTESASYFEELNHTYPVVMNLNFQGLGLPAPVFTQLAALIKELEPGLECNYTVDGICVLPKNCSSYRDPYYVYNFQFNFTSNTTDYLRTPLSTFTYRIPAIANQSETCGIKMTYLDTDSVGAENIILGGMFFQNFFTVFNNNYTGANTTQSAQIYAGQNPRGRPYVGDQSLPVGTNPWKKDVPSTGLTAWEWVLIGIGGLLLLVILVVVMLKCCFSQKETTPYETPLDDPDAIIYQTDRSTLLKEAREKVNY